MNTIKAVGIKKLFLGIALTFIAFLPAIEVFAISSGDVPVPDSVESGGHVFLDENCLLYTSPSPRD